jgi:hypothetical protein
MKTSFKHNLGKAGAVERVKQAVQGAQGQLAEHGASITQEWQGDMLAFTLDAKGQKLSGTLRVTEDSFDLEVKLPLALRLFEGKVQKMLQEAAQQALLKA